MRTALDLPIVARLIIVRRIELLDWNGTTGTAKPLVLDVMESWRYPRVRGQCELVGRSRLLFDKVTATPDRWPVTTRFELRWPEFYQSPPSKFSKKSQRLRN